MEVHPVSDIRVMVKTAAVLALLAVAWFLPYHLGYQRGESNALAGFRAECQRQLELSTWRK